MTNRHTETDEKIAASTKEVCSPVVELRRYIMHPGRRDDLIALFEEHFIEGQEQYGSRIIGQFRKRNDPDQYIWLRGFADMETRREALQGFYYGPIWQEHRNKANGTLLDNDNVLLLKPVDATSGFHVDTADRPALDAPETSGGIVIATIYTFDAPVDVQFIEFFEKEVAPTLHHTGATLLGQFVTEASKNTFPMLPVREGEQVFVWLASFADDTTHAAYQAALTQNQTWVTAHLPKLQGWLSKPEEVLELVPTRRSLLRHRQAK